MASNRFPFLIWSLFSKSTGKFMSRSRRNIRENNRLWRLHGKLDIYASSSTVSYYLAFPLLLMAATFTFCYPDNPVSLIPLSSSLELIGVSNPIFSYVIRFLNFGCCFYTMALLNVQTFIWHLVCAPCLFILHGMSQEMNP